jgi:hypothetical protein
MLKMGFIAYFIFSVFFLLVARGEINGDVSRASGTTKKSAIDFGDQNRRRRLADKIPQPTSQPTGKFVAPSVPEDAVTRAPVPTRNPVASASNKKKDDTKEKEADENEESSSKSTTVSSSDKVIAGAMNVNEELKVETRTALNSTIYFIYTFVICIVGFIAIYTLRR